MDIYDTLCGVMEILGAVFLRLVNISIAAGVMILAVALIRRAFPKMPKWLCCLLWALPALRLLLPVSIPNPFSLAPNTETVYEVRTAVADAGGVSVPVLNSGIEAVDNAVNPALERSFVAVTEGAAAFTAKARDFDPSAWFGLLWAAGCAVMLAYLLVSFLRFRRKVQPCVPYEKGVYLTDGVSAPFILGVLQPRIYLPSVLPEAHYPAILAHERAHLKRKDHWWKPLGFLVLAVHWFNPLVWLGYRLLCRDIEFACDEKVIRDADPAAKKAYAEALLTCGAPLKGTAACPLAFGEVGVKARIKRVLHYKKPAVWIAAVALLAASVAAFCFLTERPDKWVDEWNAEYVTGKVYLDPVVSPQKASREPPRTVILDDKNHLRIAYANGVSYDCGPADISGDDLWKYVKEYVPAQYRHSRPSKSPEAVVYHPTLSGYATHYVIFRPRRNVFFFAKVRQTLGGYIADSVCRLTHVGRYAREPLPARWYVSVPVKDIRYFGVIGAFGSSLTYCGHRNREGTEQTFDIGERVFLDGLDGIENVGGLTVTAYRSDHTVVYSFSVPEDAETFYTDKEGWQIARNDLPLGEGSSDPAVITAFLRTWFTPDADGRWTRLHQVFPSGDQARDEQAIADYFSCVRDYMTDRFYRESVQNRGYHAYDQRMKEQGLRVTVRGVKTETADDEAYTFTVYLQNANGADDHADGELRMKNGRVDWMRVTDMTVGRERSGGETPTSYFDDKGETVRYEEEWSTTAVDQTDPG